MHKSQRSLVIFSELTSAMKIHRYLKLFYEWLEGKGIRAAMYKLEGDYDNIIVSTGINATKDGFLNALSSAAAPQRIKAVDVILILHGVEKNLYFHRVRGVSAIQSSDLAAEISGLQLGNKLRMLYSTACWGAQHAQDFVNAGFKSASGARGINASPGISFESFVTLWSLYTFEAAVKGSATPVLDEISEEVAAVLGFKKSDIDSRKVVKGNGVFRLNDDM